MIYNEISCVKYIPMFYDESNRFYNVFFCNSKGPCMHIAHYIITMTAGFPIQISAWGGRIVPPPHRVGTDGVGQRSDGGGLARDSRQIREVTKLDFKTLK